MLIHPTHDIHADISLCLLLACQGMTFIWIDIHLAGYFHTLQDVIILLRLVSGYP